MAYQIYIDGSLVLSGGLIAGSVIIVVIAALLILVLRYFWKKLRENDKLKYEFITIIAHKFRTPLTSIKWLTEGLITEVQDARTREALTNIEQSTDKLIRQTGTLIELTDSDNDSKIGYTFEPASLNTIVKDVTTAFHGRFSEKNLSLFVQIPENDIKANVDRVRLEFVLQTLLENAVIYTPTGRRVEVGLNQTGHHAEITVADNGIGINPADISHIFSKFYRAPNAKIMDTEGFGVGLFMARSIIQRHHGRINVFSPGLNEGTVFSITLPLVR